MFSDTIAAFEPRILKGSLKVRAQLDGNDMSHNALSFEIEGDLWAEPVPCACCSAPPSTWKPDTSR